MFTSQQLRDTVTAVTNYLIHQGMTGADAASAAYGYVYKQLEQQTALLGFMDCFRVIGWLTLAAAPLMLLVRRGKAGTKAPVGH